MKIKFDMTDEVTITNTTVKVTAWIRGVINGQDRSALEAQALELAKKLFPDANWAFSNFTYNGDGFTFQVQASTRIDSVLNDQLEARADQIGEQGKLTMEISEIDASIPLHQKRDAESDLRVALIAKAKAEAEKLGGNLTEISFSQARSMALANNMRGGAMAASSMYLESAQSKSADYDGGSLGHSEKILLTASLEVTVS